MVLGYGGYQPIDPKKKQRTTGGVGLGAGAATTGAAVNSGTGVKEPVTAQQMLAEQNLGMTDTVQEATAGAMKLGRNMTTASEMMRDQERGMVGPNTNRLPSLGEPTTLGGGSLARADEGNAPSFNRANTPQTKGSTFSTYEAPDYEGAFNAVRDLRDYKNKTGAYEQEDRPMTVIGATPSYSQAIADYNSGDLRSPGYEMIRRERMDLRNQLDEATKGISSSGAKNAARERVLSAFSEQQKTRLAGEADTQKANIAADADRYKAGLEAQTKAADMAQEASFKQTEFGLGAADLERKREADLASQQLGMTRLGLEQAKEAEGIRQFESRYGIGGLEERKLGREEAEAVVSAQSRSLNDRIKAAQLELESAKNQLGEVDPNFRKKILQKYGLAGPDEE